MIEYHKIVTVWTRDPATKFRTLIEGQWAEPEFEYLSRNKWVGTEKVDGTNIRVMWDGEKVRYGGKTDNAQLPAFLIDRLQVLFYAGAMARLFDRPVCLYGEGFGPRIQKAGGNYGASVDFALFDVWCAGVWLERGAVADIAGKLECSVVPVVYEGDLYGGIEKTKNGFSSMWGDFTCEGLVLRPEIELLDRRGKRVITKIKHRDFNNG